MMRRRRAAPSEVAGGVDEGYGRVADAFRTNLRARREVGAARAVVRDGRLVVDLWGGHCDRHPTRPWHPDTLVSVFSTTKGMASMAMAVAHACGLFEVDKPVAASGHNPSGSPLPPMVGHFVPIGSVPIGADTALTAGPPARLTPPACDGGPAEAGVLRR